MCGARTPLLALRGLTRPRNLALILVPAVAVGALALLLQGRVDGRVAAGAIALAVTPAPLVAPGVVGRLRGRSDLAGALVLGTALLSLLLVGSRGALASAALIPAAEAYALASLLANVMPTVRDALLLPLRIAGWAALAVVVVAAALGGPAIDAATVAVALGSLGTGVLAAWMVAAATGRDPIAAIGGAGLRDPVLGLALATITAGPDAAGVPLVYAAACALVAAVALRAR